MASTYLCEHEASDDGIKINVLHQDDMYQNVIPLTDAHGQDLQVKEIKQILLPRFNISNPDGYRLVGRLNGEAWTELDDGKKITVYMEFLTSGCVSFQRKH